MLLKNDGTLPLERRTSRRSPSSDHSPNPCMVLHGNYSGTASHATSALDGIRKQFPSAEIMYAPGMNFLGQKTVIPAAVLSTEDGQPGLKGEYFSNSRFQRRAAVSSCGQGYRSAALPS